MKQYTGQIPFMDYPEVVVDGKIIREFRREQMSYDFGRGNIIWIGNLVFYSDLEFITYSRGRSAANFEAKVVKVQNPNSPDSKFLEGCIVNIFMVDMMKMIQSSHIKFGKIENMAFTFVKRGSNYGLTLV